MGQINRKRDMTSTAEINIDDIDAEAGAITPDQVTARCRTYEWKGKPLHAFSKTRSTAARCMGNSLFLGRAKPDENGVWDELLFDAIMVGLQLRNADLFERGCDIIPPGRSAGRIAHEILGEFAEDWIE
jgi:hypothetical protein